jgi:hypothetical protein
VHDETNHDVELIQSADSEISGSPVATAPTY